jgi:hypothetical protein
MSDLQAIWLRPEPRKLLRFLTFQWKPSAFNRPVFYFSHDIGIRFAHSHRLRDQSRSFMGKTVSLFRNFGY